MTGFKGFLVHFPIKPHALGQPTGWSAPSSSGPAWLWRNIDRDDRPPISQSAGGPDLVTCQVER